MIGLNVLRLFQFFATYNFYGNFLKSKGCHSPLTINFSNTPEQVDISIRHLDGVTSAEVAERLQEAIAGVVEQMASEGQKSLFAQLEEPKEGQGDLFGKEVHHA